MSYEPAAPSRRRWFQAAGAFGLAALGESVRADALPLALRQSAELAPKALQSGMLAVARAGARLVAVGERGTALLSDDGGNQWRQARVPVRVSLTNVRFADVRNGWAVGHMGVVLRTEDGGDSWRKVLDGVGAAALVLAEAHAANDEAGIAQGQRFVAEGPDKPFFDVICLDAQRAIAVGAFDLIVATDDAGRTWQSVGRRLDRRRGLHLYALQSVNGQLFLVGEQGLVMRSADGGVSFRTLNAPYKGSFFGILGSRSGALLAYGLRGQAYRSEDGGASWQQASTGVSVGLSAGLARGNGSVVLLSQNGDVLVSDDDARSFMVKTTLPMPATGLAESGRDDALVVAGFRGLRVLQIPR